jgi:hypothetical protein
MSKLLLAGAMALVLTTGIAVAQTTSSETTTTVTPAPLIVAPPPGTLSVTRTEKSTAPDGTQTDKTQSTYRNTNGVAEDTMTKTTTTPPPAVATTSTWSKTSTTTTE